MGIKGLTTYIAKNSHLYLEYYQLKDTHLVIDGNSLCAQIYKNHSNSNDAFGGDYDRFQKAIISFFNNLQQCNIIPIIFMDGGFEDKKLKTLFMRMKTRVSTAKRLTPASQGSMQLFPFLQTEVFKDTLDFLNIKFVVCDFEADNEIAAFARTINCPILSYDSDFFILDVLYIPFPTCDFHPRKSEQNEYYIECQIYKIEKFLGYFGGLDKSHLPLLATLLGNDYVQKKTFNNFYAHLKISHFKSEKNDQQKTIAALLNWLKYETLESAEEKILGRLKQSDRKYVSKIIRSSLDMYKYKPAIFLNYFGFDNPEENGHTQKENKTEKISEYFPNWFVEKYRQGKLPTSFVNLTTKNTYLLTPQMEDLSLPNSHNISLPIVQFLCGLLTASKKIHYFKYIARTEYTVKTLQLYPIYGTPEFNEFVSLEQLCDVPRENLANLFYEIMELSFEDISVIKEFPNEWQLVVTSIIYWARHISDIRLTRAHLSALLISMIYVKIVDVKGGYHRSKKIFLQKYESKLIKIKQNVDSNVSSTDEPLISLINNVTHEDALLSIEALISFFQISEPMKSNGKYYNPRTVHCFAEFQSVFRHVTYLNSLLNEPVEKSKIADFYNGTFIYNTYSNFKKRTNTDAYVSLILAKAVTVLDVYKHISVLFSQILPTVH